MPLTMMALRHINRGVQIENVGPAWTEYKDLDIQVIVSKGYFRSGQAMIVWYW